MEMVTFEIYCNDTKKFYCKLVFNGRIITTKILKQVEAFCGDEYYVDDVFYSYN